MTRRPSTRCSSIAFGGPEGLGRCPAVSGQRAPRPPRGRRSASKRWRNTTSSSAACRRLTAITRRQVDGLKARLDAAGVDVPVYLGMRNWHPLLPDTLRDDGAGRRATRDRLHLRARTVRYSSCTQYRQNVVGARRASFASAGCSDVSVTYVGDWHDHPRFIEANARHVRAALDRLCRRRSSRRAPRVHRAQHPDADGGRRAVSRAVAGVGAAASPTALGHSDWALVFQSRSGRPEDPWLEPDVCDYLRAEQATASRPRCSARSASSAITSRCCTTSTSRPRTVCREIGLPMARAAAVNDDPLFLDMMADAVMKTWNRYRTGRPLALSAVNVAPTAGVAR